MHAGLRSSKFAYRSFRVRINLRAQWPLSITTLCTDKKGLSPLEDLDHGRHVSRKACFRDPGNGRTEWNPQPAIIHKRIKQPLSSDNVDKSYWFAKKPSTAERRWKRADDVCSVSATHLWACCKNKDLASGTRLHLELQNKGFPEKKYSDALITMYATCGALRKAQELLDLHKSSNIIPWNALIAGYARRGLGRDALNCFKQMQSKGISPDEITYSSVLKACAAIGAIDMGEEVHDKILQQGLLEQNIVLGNALVDMYAKCGALCKAQRILRELPSPNTVTWSALIAGYAHRGQGHDALKCFEQMQIDRIVPDAVTYVCVLKACASIQALDKGKKIHDEILDQGLLDNQIVLGGALIDMYAHCGALSQAHDVLEKLPSRNCICWNSLIAGYAQEGQGKQALDCFEQMKHEGISPDAVTYVCVLKACGSIEAIDMGIQIHDEISRQGLLEHDVVVGGALIDMYAQCGFLSQARSVLKKLPCRNVVCWNALITGYAQKEHGHEVLKCLEQMQHEGVSPDKISYLAALKACGVIEAVRKGKQVHDEILSQGLLKEDIILGGALVDMYVQCGALSQAQSVLEELPSPNIVCWNCLIAGYARNGQGQQALECLKKMQDQGIIPDMVTFLSLLNLCVHLGLVEKGQELFGSMEILYGLKPDIECFTSMVDLLGQAGHLSQAVEFVHGITCRPNSALLHCLLCSCQKWLDIDLGLWVFHQSIELDKCDGAAYALMSSLYAAAGLPEKAKDIETMRLKHKA